MPVLVGCGGNLGDVRGHVTSAGNPVTNVVIHFLPEQGPEAQARLDETGNYRLTTPGKGTGAVLGKHHVYFVPSVDEKEEEAKANLNQQDYIAGKLPNVSRLPPKSSVPTKYLSANSSDLVREVKSSSNEFDFELSSQ